jgi:hypothetical protein
MAVLRLILGLLGFAVALRFLFLYHSVTKRLPVSQRSQSQRANLYVLLAILATLLTVTVTSFR